MPVRINQPIKQTTLNDSVQDFIKFMGKYTTFDDFVAEAEKALDETIRDELEFELPGRCTIEYDSNEDGKFNYINGDDFVEWLMDNYEVRPR